MQTLSSKKPKGNLVIIFFSFLILDNQTLRENLRKTQLKVDELTIQIATLEKKINEQQ
jgi:hypothetical protein